MLSGFHDAICFVVDGIIHFPDLFTFKGHLASNTGFSHGEFTVAENPRYVDCRTARECSGKLEFGMSRSFRSK